MDTNSSALKYRSNSRAVASEEHDSRSKTKTVPEHLPSNNAFGRTPAGHKFLVPETQDMVSTLLLPTKPKSLGDLAVIGVSLMHVVALLWLPERLRVSLFAVAYLFWRASYNLGIGYLLHEQSNNRRLVRWTEKLGLFACPKNNPLGKTSCELLIRELQTKLPKDFDLRDAPTELVAWLLFRRVTDLVLMSDFTSYCCFAIAASNNPPPGESITMSVLRWSTGIGLVLFNLWVKLDAHRVVKDYAWYWGDFFFLIEQQLTFDGVFEMAPHPMYSVGYAGYYGISLMAASYKVLFISILAHAAQFAFLVWVENPHIDKTYNVPLSRKRLLEDTAARNSHISLTNYQNEVSGQTTDAASSNNSKMPRTRKIVGLRNLDLFRLTDTTTILLQAHLLFLAVATPSSPFYQKLFALNAAAWRLWYSVGIGIVLNRQSTKKSWTRHFVKYGESNGEAWRQWQGLYHISMHMTYLSFLVAAWKAYKIPTDWNSDMALLNHVVGLSLVLLQIWTAMSIYESLGEFGWFFGDFFFDHAPKLTYSGIYRFLNNPERVIGLAGLWGTVLITKSRAIFLLSLLSHVLSLLFIQFVERPHMQRLYGQSLREDSGLSRSLRKSLPSTLRKWQGSMDKMLEESFEFVEEFLDGARPRVAAGFNTFVKDSTSLFKHPARVTITRLDPDMAGYDPKDYSLEIIGSIPANETQPLCFSYGEPIRVKWSAPLNHSSKDWVGLYRVADNASWTVTQVSSAGRWICTNLENYDNVNAGKGVILSDRHESGSERKDGETKDYLSGEMEFAGDKMFWTEGVFEIRYHHNGKHNVMAISRAFEVRVDRFNDDDVEISDNRLMRNAIEQTLLPVVRDCFDRDPEIAPIDATEGYGTAVAREPKYSRRVAYAVSRLFGIDFAPEVVQADGNVRNLAWRICNAKKVLAPYSMSGSKGRSTPSEDY